VEGLQKEIQVYILLGEIESILEKGDLSQDEYFKMIVDINSAESREILQQ
jgi:putative ABC transport system ATP-binding protein